MSVTKAKFGKPVPLMVDAKGFPDGRAVLFEIWKETGGNKDKIDEINGVVRREKGIGQWEPNFKREPTVPLKDKISPQPQKEQYSFIALMDKGEANEKKTQGTPIEFTFPLEIQVEDVNGKPINDVKFTITFSDGSSIDSVLKNGYAKIDDAPAGKFSVKLEGYDFVFK
jgi:hypothetical protein